MKQNQKKDTRLIVDRLEDGCAVCESQGGGMIRLPLERLSSGVREGDVLIQQNGKYRTDPDATKKRRAEVDAKRKKLFGR
ncbi:MAG TPA: DUF3006 domain-containing protein [Candidatus Eisenbergiella intestinipullorum]|nr:DUF3006 domain-containing protein [Candidatus Eisenbergiella intestinipullorum]